MILQALTDYYDRKATDPDSDIAPDGWEWKEIPFIIVIDHDGNFLRLEETTEGEGKKARAKRFLVPLALKRAGVKPAANLLWDNPGYVIGYELDTKSKTEDDRLKQKEKILAKMECFRDQVYSVSNSLKSIQPIKQFYENNEFSRIISDEALISRINNTVSANMFFRVEGAFNNLFENPELRSFIEKKEGSVNQGVCLITGKPDGILNLHAPIKGVKGNKSMGGSIVSYNFNSVCSYGKSQGMNAPVGEIAGFKYVTALNSLLSKDSRQKMSVGENTVIFWSERKTSFEESFPDFFSEPPKDDPDALTRAVENLFSSIHTGAYTESDEKTRFFVLGLAPNAARISIRFWYVSTVSEISDAIRTHFDDLKIAGENRYPSVWKLMVHLASQGKSENIPDHITGDFIKAIISKTPYPATLLSAAIQRIRADVDGRVDVQRAQLIKAYLNRQNRFYKNPKYKELEMSLDTEQKSEGYLLGRLFAMLEYIQSKANPGLNSTIRDRYYGAASATPVTVFPILMKLKNHHMAKLENKGTEVWLEGILEEIFSKLSGFPANLNIHDQGMFAVGYYHQRSKMYEPKKDKKDSNEN